MMKKHKPPIRCNAVGMINGGMIQVQVVRELGIDMVTLRRWLARD